MHDVSHRERGSGLSMTDRTCKGRSFLKELDFTPEEWRSLLDLAQHLKLE